MQQMFLSLFEHCALFFSVEFFFPCTFCESKLPFKEKTQRTCRTAPCLFPTWLRVGGENQWCGVAVSNPWKNGFHLLIFPRSVQPLLGGYSE